MASHIARHAWSAAASRWALLPVRLFFGATFLIAGLDKLLDPAFLDPSSPSSIGAQLAAFARISPLGGFVAWSEPHATAIGLAIATAEIGVGLGALSGVALRPAAAVGLLLSLLFWLTASWGTRPFYYGADLPYAVGWCALTLAGPGDRWVLRRSTRRADRSAGDPDPAAPLLARRAFLESAALTVVAVAVASGTTLLRLGSLTGIADGQPGGAPSPSPSPGVDPPPADPLAIATVAGLEERRAIAFRVPFDAPAPLPAGDPGVLLQLPDGRFVAYDAICTHAGCTVAWNAADALLECPCHGATYDPADAARVLSGPTLQPLSALRLEVDPATGIIRLATS